MPGGSKLENLINTLPIPVVFLFLIAGFALLIKGADFFVEGSSAVAHKFKVPSIIIGLTVVAMGTSLPETAVSVTASIAGKNSLAISNVTGSNIFNIIMVIGVCALLTPVAVQKETLKRDLPFSALCACLLGALGILSFGDPAGMTLGNLDGIILLTLFVIYLSFLVITTLKARKSASDKDEADEGDETKKNLPIWLSLIFIVGGAAAIVVGGDLTVDSASRIAMAFGMSETLVGLTIVSIGTSLPELVTSVVAAHKNEVDMALGNAIGSNVFNILMVLGIAAAISPVTMLKENVIDIAVLLCITLVVWVFAYTKKQINRIEGGVMVAMYAAYAVYICLR
ncbi:MAG: calcium/sodium antiporter [Lachnospiraceae bacterium]|nr:calcium/sodium antiporter [Lachnospiraceae bacterium]